MKDYKDIDDVLKQSLSSKESPSIGLNVELRIKMENQIEENKGISIWWLPMTISTCISAMAYILVKLFMDYNVQMDAGFNYGLEGTYISNQDESNVKIGIKAGYSF